MHRCGICVFPIKRAGQTLRLGFMQVTVKLIF